MNRTIPERLFDAIDALDKIEHYTNGLTRAEFETQRDIQLIVERLVITVGEALHKAKVLDQTMGARIPGMSQFIAAGRQVLYSTSKIEPAILWEIVVDKGPRLRESLRLAIEGYRSPVDFATKESEFALPERRVEGR